MGTGNGHARTEDFALGIESLLRSASGSDGIAALAANFGIDHARAETAATSLANALSQRIQRNTLSRGGVADMVALLGDPAAARGSVDAGNGVLGVLTGSKHISRGIAARAASESGIDLDVAKKMLPEVASMLIGGLQRQSQSEFGRLERDVPELAVSRNGSPLPLPGEVPMDSGPSSGGASGGGRWGSEDSADAEPQQRPAPQRPARPISGGSPLPLPGDHIPGLGRDAPHQDDAPDDNPFNNLPDIIRRGGVQVPGGGSLENVIRSILGGLLGFQNRGILGSLFQLFLIKFLPGILKSIFGRVLGRS